MPLAARTAPRIHGFVALRAHDGHTQSSEVDDQAQAAFLSRTSREFHTEGSSTSFSVGDVHLR